ncbi:MAG: hypothetical protein VZR27_02625 [Acutalibacteraceae bacterium]|nr:hypothetical protein [Acutalibacteraceae bacterium]
MKAFRGCFRQKNSKRGMALSTTMAICIVLALLTALLVSMASLNITTTQATVGQRAGYIQAKSAIAFAESYYSQHSDQIPGNSGGDTGGTALMVFRDNVIAHGADIYLVSTSSQGELIPQAKVNELKKNAVDTYLDITNTGSILDITAYCRYGGDDDMYTLTREFDFTDTSMVRPNAFSGNIVYKPTSDTRFLRIHVRASASWGYEPYLYTYGSTRNSSDSSSAYGGSSIVNKLSNDPQYPSLHFSGDWISADDLPDEKQGPTGAMTYEGNGWYVYEVTFASNTNINYINAIVTRKGALRKRSGFNGASAQSWEFFGIPVPKQTGEGNGADVYITLNQKSLRDARMCTKTAVSEGYEWSDTKHLYSTGKKSDGFHDELTYLFESVHSADIDDFAQFSGKWYTVYTKEPNTAIVHYKRAGVNDKSVTDLPAVPGLTYEGYGWYRAISYNFLDEFPCKDQSFYFGDDYRSRILTQNSYGKDVVRESFIVEGMNPTELTNQSEQFPTEEEANDWIASNFKDPTAGDYITVYARANEMPVDAQVDTFIDYESELIDNATSVPSPSGASVPKVGTLSAADEELKVENLGKANIALSGDAYTAGVSNWGIAGDFNDWARNGGSENRFEYLTMPTSSDGSIFTWVFDNLPAGTYKYKFVAKTKNKGVIDSNWYGNGGDNYSVTIGDDTKLTITFDKSDATSSYTTDSADGNGSGSTFAVIGWLNQWGQEEPDGPHLYRNLAVMNHVSGGNYELEAPLIDGDEVITFKIVRKLSDEGALEDNDNLGWHSGNCWGGSGDDADDDGNYVASANVDVSRKFKPIIKFNEYSGAISVELIEVNNTVDVDFFVVGDNNSWCEHNYDAVLAGDNKMSLENADPSVNTYKLELGTFEVGTFQFKIISTNSHKDDGTIDYTTCWGAADGNGVTYGKDGEDDGFKFTLDYPSEVTAIFKYNIAEPSKSVISYQAVKLNLSGEEINPITVGFYNAQLTNKNDSNQKTNFTAPWEKVYVTYNSPRGLTKDKELTAPSAEDPNPNCWWATVPSDAYYIYFSNAPHGERGNPGYEYTVDIQNADFATVTNPIFVPVSANDKPNGKEWEMGNNTFYRSYTSTTKTISGSEKMVYTGAMQVNYYDVPIVKLLMELVPDKNKKYCFSSHAYTNGYDFKTDGVSNPTFSADHFVTYQGEKYYYDDDCSAWGFSYLLVKESNGNNGGILLENHFALISNVQGVSTRMDNRAGAVFTSSGTYYHGDDCPHSYDNYAPNWYTFKIPTSSEVLIKNIKGVTSDSTYLIKNNATSIKVAKSGNNYNYPLYLYRDPNGKLQCYTYDTYIGNVDTTPNDTVSIYLNKPDSWSNNVGIHAYGVQNDGNFDAQIDRSNADNTFYRFEFDTGDYCFFEFFDKDAPTANRTGTLCFTGIEENREYQILCDPTNALNRGGTPNNLVFFCHPKTLALYGYQDARSAKNATTLNNKYTYHGDTKSYSSAEKLIINEFETMEENAKNNYERAGSDKHWSDGGSPAWSAGDSANYTQAVEIAKNFATAISNTRIYIADSIDPEDGGEYSGDYIFPEGSYRDSVVQYAERWVNCLRNVYSQAIGLYGDGSNGNILGDMIYYTDELNAIISYPEIELSSDAVQIIVDNQAVETTEGGVTTINGGWDISKIALWNKNESNQWVNTGLDLYETTQSNEGFYAYVFKNNFATKEFCIARTDTAIPNDVTTQTMQNGRRYTYHTATGKFEEDKSLYTVKCNYDLIDENDYTAAYGAYYKDNDNKPFIVYFNYDTTVKYKKNLLEHTYTIYAGAYTISKAAYKNFTTDFSDPNRVGINLFTDEAEKFFKNKARIGLANDVGSTPYTAWGTSLVTTGPGSKDIMIDGFDLPAGTDAEAKAGTADRINFRFKNAKNDDTLTLDRNVDLEAGVVTIAANNIDLNNKNFTITAKTVVFRTDTLITTPQGRFTISHGTYLYNLSSSVTSAEISLGTTGSANDWRKHYVLVDETKSDLGGGVYIGN